MKTVTPAAAAMASLLNLTFLPGVAFIWLLFQYPKASKGSIAEYHFLFAIKLNIVAFILLLCVSALMLWLGGFDSPWTWVYIISYFTLVHGLMIMIAVWALTKAWADKKVVSGEAK